MNKKLCHFDWSLFWAWAHAGNPGKNLWNEI